MVVFSNTLRSNSVRQMGADGKLMADMFEYQYPVKCMQ